jgi:hypothetical protein
VTELERDLILFTMLLLEDLRRETYPRAMVWGLGPGVVGGALPPTMMGGQMWT